MDKDHSCTDGLDSQLSNNMVTATMKLKDAPWKESYHKTREHIEKQRYHR